MRIVMFGQAAFGRDVMVRLLESGHEVRAVYAPPEASRPDPLAAEAESRAITLLRHKYFRRDGRAIPERVKEYEKFDADLNVMAYVTVFLPEEIIDGPRHKSICFHPSILPAFRGGAAIPWQIILGATEVGVSVFRPDEGVDTGPIVIQKRGVEVLPSDNAASLYFDKLYPLGVEAMVEAVEEISAGRAKYRIQLDEDASHQGLIGDADSRLDWRRPAEELDRLARGCDPQPGSWAELGGHPVRFFGCSLNNPRGGSAGEVLAIDETGILISARGGSLRFTRLRRGQGPKVEALESEISLGEVFN